MKLTRTLLLFTALICALVLCLAGCGRKSTPLSPQELPAASVQRPSMPAYENPRGVTVWAAYWDAETVRDELALYDGTLEALCYFEAYFDTSDRPALPTELVQLKKRLENAATPWISYLTFVNDVQNADGSFSNKDTDFLRRVLADDATMEAHAQLLVQTAAAQGFGGLELDYEAIKQDEALWAQLAAFTARLYARAQEAGLRLRVVLEPSAPFSVFSSIDGPDYVVMCYNLYGSHSGAGPKATPAFIEQTVSAASAHLPGRIDFALATGGFDWPSKGKATALTELDARSLLRTFAAEELRRDAESGCVVFRYQGADKMRHEVWYADGETLATWAYAVRAAGNYGLSIWRLGGNADDSCIASYLR